MEVALVLAVLFLGLYGLIFVCNRFRYRLFLNIEMCPVMEESDDDGGEEFEPRYPVPSQWEKN